MSTDTWLNIIGGIILVVVPVLFGLMKLLHTLVMKRIDVVEQRQHRFEDRVEDRFRSTGHSIREIWAQLQGITTLFIRKNGGSKGDGG